MPSKSNRPARRRRASGAAANTVSVRWGTPIQNSPGPGAFVMIGHIICTNLQNGADPMMGMSFIERGTYGPAAVDAARHELCPGR